MSTEETIEYVSGISLGQANESTALAVVERRTPPEHDEDERPLSEFSVRHLERFPIGTTYAAVFERVSTLFSSMPLPGNTLEADQTAVGEPVMRSLRRAWVLGGYRGVVITNGLEATYDSGFWQVPKKDLVGTLQVLLQEQRLRIAAQLPEVPTLVEELLNFQMKPAPVSTDPLAAWREGPQDHLLFAIAVSTWWIERGRKRFFVWL
jgi:hypothetical protein